ncbi:hypothetical protein [Nonomuraea sp. bgisy101]|uniref:hypothetical protein n=1 Tax=Nonomuraea sp. bgisy101 TaxID=3413784 RepID=UPI003D75C93C
MADRTVSVRLKLGIHDFQTNVRAASRDLRSLNREFSRSSSFAEEFRRQLENAVKRLPKLEIDADSSAAEIKLAQVRAELESLSRKEIGLDVDAGDAILETRRLQDELLGLDRDVSVEVHASIQDAMRDLSKVDAEMDRLRNQRLGINVNVDTSSALDSFGKLTMASGELGGALSRALSVVGSTAPTQVGLAAAAIQALPVVASAAAAGIVASLGASLATVGITAAAQSKIVKARWTQLGVDLKRELADTAKPLEGSLLRAADVAQVTFERLQPSLRRIFSGLVPDVDAFVRAAGDALATLGPSLERLGGSFGTMLRELGNRMPEIVGHLSAAFDKFSDIVAEDPQMLADLIEDATKLLSMGADILSWAGQIRDALTFPIDASNASNSLFRGVFGTTPEELQADMAAVPDTLAGVQGAVTNAISTVQGLATGAGSTGDALTGLGTAASTAAGGVDTLRSKLGELIGITTNALSSEISYQRALDNATAAAKENGRATSSNSEAGRKNRETLIGLAESANSYRQALVDQGTPMAEVEAKLGTQRSAFVKVAESMGFSKKEANNLATALGLIPNNVKTDIKNQGGKEALALIKELERKLNALDGKTVTTAVNQVIRYSRQDIIDKNRERGAIDYYELGGIRAFASGGMTTGPRPGPHIATRPTVLYGEGKGPEAFIPYDPAFRKRAISLLGQVADDFGLQLFNREAEEQAIALRGGLREANYGISTSLESASAMLDQTLGSAGSLTGSIVRVGDIGVDMTAGWVEGSAALGESVTGMGAAVTGAGSKVSTSLGALGKSVDDLAAVIGKAASSTSAARESAVRGTIPRAGSKATNASLERSTRKLPPAVQTGDKYGPSDEEIRRRLAARQVPGGSLHEAAFASGGFIAGPTWSLMGEDGPEVVIPLSSRHRGEALHLLEKTSRALGVGHSLERGSIPRQGSASAVRSSRPLGAAVPGGSLRDAYGADSVQGVSLPPNSARVSRPQQMRFSGYVMSPGAAGQGFEMSSAVGGSGGGGAAVVIQEQHVHQNADADLVNASIAARWGGRG